MAVFCPACGAQNRDGAKFCASCQAAIPAGAASTGPAAGAAAARESKVTSWEHKIGFPILSVLVGAVCIVYLINPTAGVLELLPDNLPFVGNLDEVAAVAGLLQALTHIGFIEYVGQRIRFHSLDQVRAKWRRGGAQAPGANVP